LAAAFLDNQIEIFQLGQVWECLFQCFSAQIACTMAKKPSSKLISVKHFYYKKSGCGIKFLLNSPEFYGT